MKQKLTSVKVDIDCWDNFRKLSIDEKITFRELVRISLLEFINNKSYRNTIKKKVTKYEKEDIIIKR